MGNPYPAEFQTQYDETVRLDGEITFTDPSNQPGGGSGTVDSVTAGDASITIGGTLTDPTVAVSGLGVTTSKLAANAVTQAKLADASVDETQMASVGQTANWVPLADGSGGVAWGASPGVNSLSAADTSIVVAGTGSAPTVRTGTLDVIATQHPPAADWSNNSKKITSLANGSSAQDAAAFGQIPTSLPPSGSAGGDLSGTYPDPTVAAIQGVAVSGTAPTASQVLTAADATHAAWADPSGGGVASVTAGDTSIVIGGTSTDPTVETADLSVIATDHATAGNVSMNSHKLTSLAAGSANGDSVRYQQSVTGIVTAKGDLVGATASHTPARLAVGTNGQVLEANSAQSTGLQWVSLATWSTFAPSPTGFSGTPTVDVARYCQIGKLVVVNFGISGTSNSTSKGFSLPVTASSDYFLNPCWCQDSGIGANIGYIEMATTTTVNVSPAASGAWTASGTAELYGQFTYEAA